MTKMSFHKCLERKPFFTQPSKMKKTTLIIPAGNKAKIVCAASGVPSPTVVWYKNGKPLKRLYDSLTPITTTDFVLDFHSLRPKDNGKYVCLVSNKLGNVSASFDLIVKGGSGIFFRDGGCALPSLVLWRLRRGANLGNNPNLGDYVRKSVAN